MIQSDFIYYAATLDCSFPFFFVPLSLKPMYNTIWWLVLRSDFTLLRRYIGLLHFPFSLSLTMKPLYDMIWWVHLVWYDLVGSPCTIWSGSSFRPRLYDINLRAMHTTILSIRGVTIPIYLVSSATDSIRSHVVLFKAVTIPTSDPKSEFLCQSSLSCTEPADPPWTPHTPGISPTPSSPHITHMVRVLVLSPSTWSRSSVYKELSVLVTASPLKSSRMFHLNVTLTQTSTWLPPPPNTLKGGENETSLKGTSRKQTGAKTDPSELDTTSPAQMTRLSWSQSTPRSGPAIQNASQCPPCSRFSCQQTSTQQARVGINSTG